MKNPHNKHSTLPIKFQKEYLIWFRPHTSFANHNWSLKKHTHTYHIVGSEVSWRHHSEGTCPKPSIDVQGLEPGGITAFNFSITQPSSSVDIVNITGFHQAFDEVLFLSWFKAHHVHAHFSAVVSASEPVPTGISQSVFITSPRDPVTFATKSEMTTWKENGSNK